MCACSFVWTKEPKATATRKSRGRTLGGLKRAPKAVLQAKRPRFPDGPDRELPPGRVFDRRFRSTSCTRFGPSVARRRVRPCFPDFRKAGDARVTCFPHEDRLSGFFPSSSSLLPLFFLSSSSLLPLFFPSTSHTESLLLILVRTKIRLGIGPHSPSKSSTCFFLIPKKLLRGNPPFDIYQHLFSSNPVVPRRILTAEKLRKRNPPFENQGRSEDAESGVKKRIGSGALPSRKLQLEDLAQNR